MLFAHGDPITLVVTLVLKALGALAENAGPIAAVILKVVAIVLVLPVMVFVANLVCGAVTAIFVRRKRWLFLATAFEALVLYGVFCVPPAVLLLDDWPWFWIWLVVGLGAAVSAFAGLLNSSVLVAVVAGVLWLRRRHRKESVPAAN